MIYIRHLPPTTVSGELSLLFIEAYSVWRVITAHNPTPLNRDH